MRRSHVGWMLAAFLLAASIPALAQQGTSEFSGKVMDEQGAILPGVTVVFTNEETGAFREVVSGADGSFFASQMIPGRYKVSAKLPGFRNFERGGLILQVGKTLTINVSMVVGGLEETVHVTAESPLVDTTSAKVGGNIGTDALAELPAMNRNYFSTVALLPGIQFAPSNQMGNDTIVASGQTTQNNNVSVDGGYNGDDALGTSSGAQVRVPLESIQEFQVITSMYDAEFGRASGAIVNAVTKVGTNQFKGVIFGYTANNDLTAMDYFVKQSQGTANPLAKPTTTKREYGGVIGGPIIKNKAQFFFSLERQVDNPNRTRAFPTRPSLDFSLAEDRTDWNTLIRVDHQINANHTWAVRWLREWAPQWYTIGTKVTKESFQDETDLDQTAVGTLTSVLSNARVNTVRVARTWEHWWHGNACFRAQGPANSQEGYVFGNETTGNQALCPPQLNYPSFLIQASTESQGPWDSNYQIEDDYSWFLPGKKGDHDMKYGFRYNFTRLRRASQINENGTYTFSTAGDPAFNPADPRTYPDRFSIRTGMFQENVVNHTYEAFAQDRWHVRPSTTINLGVRYDLEIIPIDETGNPLFKDPNAYPVDKNNISPRLGFTHTLDENGKNLIRGGYGIFYNRSILGAVDDALEFGKFTNSVVVNFPANAADPGPGRGQLPVDPTLIWVQNNGLATVNRAYLNSLYPPGALVKNDGTVIFDSPNRKQPYAHQATIGFVRELMPQLALHVDYVHMKNKDMFLSRNLNPGVRVDTSRTGTVNRVDAFGVLGEPYKTDVWVMENLGDSTYDGLNMSLEKRYSHNWSGRISYSLSKSRGTGENQADRDTYQTLTDLNLGLYDGPSSVDRKHVLSIAARYDIPKTKGANLSTTIRYMSGFPFTIYNSNVDVNQNGSLDDPSPAGTYSGPSSNPAAMQNVEFDGRRNGARGPNYFQADVRAGYRVPLARGQAMELFLDIFNITNRANFDLPITANRDQRLATTNFLVLTNLYGGGGFPRQAYFGVRYVF
jgi:Carboxypeptidase regulatory-like domain